MINKLILYTGENYIKNAKDIKIFNPGCHSPKHSGTLFEGSLYVRIPPSHDTVSLPISFFVPAHV